MTSRNRIIIVRVYSNTYAHVFEYRGEGGDRKLMSTHDHASKNQSPLRYTAEIDIKICTYAYMYEQVQVYLIHVPLCTNTLTFYKVQLRIFSVAAVLQQQHEV